MRKKHSARENPGSTIQVYATQAKDRASIDHATDIRMRAERRAGELLAEMEKNKGAVPGKTGIKARPVLDDKPKLSDLKITKTQSSKWQALARLHLIRGCNDEAANLGGLQSNFSYTKIGFLC